MPRRTTTPGGVVGAVLTVMIVMFILGFFLDFIEITLVVVPLVGPRGGALLRLRPARRQELEAGERHADLVVKDRILGM